MEEEEKKPFGGKLSSLSTEEQKELALWEQRAKVWFPKGRSAVEWECKHLREEIAAPIRMKLSKAESYQDIKNAFE